MFCIQIKHADAIMRIPLHFLRSAIKVSESRSPPWHVQSKSKPKTFDSILKFVSGTVKVTPHNERYRKVTNIFGRSCCSRLLTIAHDFSRSLIFFDRYIVALFAENVPFEVLGPYFLGPLCYVLTIAHDLCARVDCSHLPANLLFDQVSARAHVSSGANCRQDLELPY